MPSRRTQTLTTGQDASLLGQQGDGKTPPLTEDGLLSELERFCEFGSQTLVQEADGITYFVNEFWTSSQRQANRIHEVSYRACFKPQLPAFFIDRLTEPGDIVYDPFMGRGTTPVEAALKGRVAYGNDANPLGKVFAEPRIDPPGLAQIIERLSMIPWADFKDFKHEDLLVFFHPKTMAQIEGLRAWLFEREKKNRLDKVDKWIRMIAINRLTGHSTGFFSVYTMPPNQAVSIERQALINEKKGQEPAYRDVRSIIEKKSRTLLSQWHRQGDDCSLFVEKPSNTHRTGNGATNSHRLFTGLSHDTPGIEDDSVTLTVTSPPFLDVVDYESDNWLRNWFLGVESTSVGISSHRKVEDWQDFVARTLAELARVTKPGGHIAFEVGEVRNGTVRLEENVIAATGSLPLEPLAVMVNQQEFTKTSNCWGVTNNKGGTNSNRIVILRKDG